MNTTGHERAGVEHEQVGGRVGLHLRDGADGGAVGERRPSRRSARAPTASSSSSSTASARRTTPRQRVGLLADVDAVEVHDPPVLVGRRAHHGERRHDRCAAPCRGRARSVRSVVSSTSTSPRTPCVFVIRPPRAIRVRRRRPARRSREACGGRRAKRRPEQATAQSSNSTSTSTPSRTAAARTMVRMALATRPRLPITRPMSSGPTRTSRRTRPRCSIGSMRTASGSSTSEVTSRSRTEIAVGAGLGIVGRVVGGGRVVDQVDVVVAVVLVDVGHASAASAGVSRRSEPGLRLGDLDAGGRRRRWAWRPC